MSSSFISMTRRLCRGFRRRYAPPIDLSRFTTQYESRNTPRRKYEQKKRADDVAETRLRITEAAIELHGTVGPSRTTLSAVARRAGVERRTLYRHFPTEAELFAACSTHYFAANPWPDLDGWRAIRDPRRAARAGPRRALRLLRAHRADVRQRPARRRARRLRPRRRRPRCRRTSTRPPRSWTPAARSAGGAGRSSGSAAPRRGLLDLALPRAQRDRPGGCGAAAGRARRRRGGRLPALSGAARSSSGRPVHHLDEPPHGAARVAAAPDVAPDRDAGRARGHGVRRSPPGTRRGRPRARRRRAAPARRSPPPRRRPPAASGSTSSPRARRARPPRAPRPRWRAGRTGRGTPPRPRAGSRRRTAGPPGRPRRRRARPRPARPARRRAGLDQRQHGVRPQPHRVLDRVGDDPVAPGGSRRPRARSDRA